MTSKKEFREWLENESYHPLLIEDSPGWETVHCKVPKDHRYVYLFSLKYGYSEMKSVSELQNVGIYDKVRKKIYNSNGHFSMVDPDIEYRKSISEMRNEVKNEIETLVEKLVDQNSAKLGRIELSDWEKEQLENYSYNGVARDARKAFVEGKTQEGIRYECEYYFNGFCNEDEYLSYIDNPTAFMEEIATQYFENHEQDIFLKIKKNELLKAEILELEQMKDSPTHRLRGIMTAAKSTDAKTLSVTACKEGKTLTFKIEANALRRDPSTYYMSWDIPAKDRREFERTFGERSCLCPEDIIDISYCGKSIYSAEPYEEPVESEEISQTM